MKEKGSAKENRAFEEMRKVAKEWLNGRTPSDIAEKTGFRYEKETSQFHGNCMGEKFVLNYPDYEISPYINEWNQLLLLHYMKLADGIPLFEKWISMRDMKDGLIRGGNFDRRCEQVISQRIGEIPPEKMIEKCKAMGGRIIKSNADLTVQFMYLPYFPMLLKIWFADEEFSASGKLLVDASADHYLTIEDVVMAGQVLMEQLVGVF